MTAKSPIVGIRLILAARTDGLPSQLNSTGFYPMAHGEALAALEAAGLWLGPRPILEESPEFRQIIPYILLRYGSKVVRYMRTPSGGEARLHGRMSVGLGGHIDLADIRTRGEAIDLHGTVECAADRELQEELGGVDCSQKEWVGLVVEHDSDVGRVHIGLVGMWDLSREPDGVLEDAIGEVGLASFCDLEDQTERLETWSSLLLPWLSEILATEKPVARAA